MRLSTAVPGLPPGSYQELERLEWRPGDAGEPADLLADLLAEHGLDGPAGGGSTGGGPAGRGRGTVVALLLGANGCARLAGLPAGPASPVPAVPELVAVALRAGDTTLYGPQPGGDTPYLPQPPRVGEWASSWTDPEHAAAVETVRAAIARGEVYQANVVGHRSAGHSSDPRDVAAAVAGLPGATYGGTLSGQGWAVGCASPEQLVRVAGDRISTVPIKGTLRVAPGAQAALRASSKDRAEHVMIVDLERNDLSRVAVTGSVEVEELYALTTWAGLWHASSTVAARLRPDVTVLDVLRALVPGGSVTGAPKRAACALLADLEPVGRGPAMGALGVVTATGLELGLTIRTVGVDHDRVHLWAGGGITWGSDAAAEVEEAHAKAGPVLRTLSAAASC
ncbi:MAG: chorismate-binding protein [Mycobacteriales bacterium]